jgi:hypothetical protein
LGELFVRRGRSIWISEYQLRSYCSTSQSSIRGRGDILFLGWVLGFLAEALGSFIRGVGDRASREPCEGGLNRETSEGIGFVRGVQSNYCVPGSCSCSSPKGSGREASDLAVQGWLLSRPISQSINDSALTHHQRRISDYGHGIHASSLCYHSRTTALPRLSTPHVRELPQELCSYPKPLSTANAGDWVGKCEQGKQGGTWRSILDAMGAAQGSATKKSKQRALFAVCERDFRLRCFPTKAPRVDHRCNR